MGLLGSFLKAVGRGIGKMAETAGRITGCERLKKIGQEMQWACQSVSKSTGNTDSYDKEQARLEETRNINKILTDFTLQLEKKADEIEKKAIKESNVYFKELVHEMRNSRIEFKINIDSIQMNMNRIERKIKGNLKSYISQRVSIDDDECLEILKMDAGIEKEREMKKFSKEILKLGLKNLIKDVKEVINLQGDIIINTIQEKIKDVKFDLDKKIEEFNLLEQSKSKTEQDVELLKSEINSKLQLTQACLDLFKEEI